MKIMKTTLVIVLAAALISVLTACSGVVGGDTTVRISTDSSIGSRHISGSAEAGYVVVVQEDRVYSLNNFSDMAFYYLVNGSVVITNLPVGDYVFGIVLTDEAEDHNYGLAIKEVSIKKGFNDVTVVVGPGIADLEIGGKDLSEFFYPDGTFDVSFETDTIIFDKGVSGVVTAFGFEGYTHTSTPVTGGTRYTANLYEDPGYDSITVIWQ